VVRQAFLAVLFITDYCKIANIVGLTDLQTDGIYLRSRERL